MRMLPPAVLTAFVVLAAYYSLVIPPWEAVDELDHHHYAQYLLTHGTLPQMSTLGQSQEVLLAHHPPLYYVALALVIAPADRGNPKESVRTNLDWHWGDPNYGGYNRFFHGGDGGDPAEDFPYSGPVRALHVGRLFSILGGVLVLVATWQTVRLLFGPMSHGLAATAMAIVGFIPGFLVSSATVHHDSWVAALGSLGIWRGLVYLQKPTILNVALFALLLGLAALTKASMLALGLLLPLAIGLAWTSYSRGGGHLSWGQAPKPPAPALPNGLLMSPWRAAGSPRTLVVHLAIAFAIYLGIVGWWLLRNQALYGDPLGWAVFLSSPLWPVHQQPINPATIAAEIVAEWAPGSSFWRTLLFGAGQMTFDQQLVLNLAFAGLTLGSTGLAVLAYRNRSAARTWGPTAIFAALAVGLVVASIVRYSLSFFGPNGRYLFPALPLISIGIVLGWRALLPRIAIRPFGSVTLAALSTLAVLTPSQLFLPQYALANQLDPSQAAALQPNQAVVFGRQIELIHAEITPQRAEPGAPVRARLTWRALVDIPRSYRAFVHLIGADGTMAGGVDRVPAGGAASTGLWRKGDVVFDDFEVPLRPTTGAGLYRAVGGFYQFPDLARLPAEGAQATTGDVALLGRVKLLPNVTWAGQPVARFGEELVLARAEIAPRLPRVNEDLEIRLLWQALQRPRTDYTVSVQLLAPDGSLLAQRDSPPLNGALPTTDWEAGDLVPDTFTLRVPPGVPARFSAQLVVYSSATGQRLRVGSGDSFPLASLTLEPQ